MLNDSNNRKTTFMSFYCSIMYMKEHTKIRQNFDIPKKGHIRLERTIQLQRPVSVGLNSLKPVYM